MEQPPQPRGLIRFGVFEVDLEAGELRKHSLKIKLQQQPFQILAMLLEHPGRVVTREELRQKLWPADTFVDFDHSVSKAINKLREALNDSADSPRFVETLPRRGYRLIAPAEVLPFGTAPLAGAADAVATPQPGWGATPGPGLSSPAEASSPPGTRKAYSVNTRLRLDGRRHIIRWALATLAVVSAGGWGLRRLSSPLPIPVVDFIPITNDGRAKAYSGYRFSPLVTDGSRVYFTETTAGGFVLAEVSASGGETGLVFTPSPLPQLAAISLARSELLVAGFKGTEAEAPLWAIPIPVGAPRRLGAVLGHDGTWSLDGQTLVYASGRHLYIAKSDGSEPRRLVTLGGIAWWPRWSPDAKSLRFTLVDPKTNSTSLWEISPDGTHLRPLLANWNNPPAECCGSWTSDGKYFLFQATRGGMTNLWVIPEKANPLHIARRRPEPLTSGGMKFRAPVPSVDGKKLFAVGEHPHGELVRYDVKSGHFVPYLLGPSVEAVDLTRDGEWVAYVAYPAGGLWRSRADGSQRLQLSSPPLVAHLPRWSPDGRRIAFMGQVPGGPWKIYLASAEGGDPQPAAPGEANEGEPSWSPSGEMLAFDGAPWAQGWAPGTTAIYVLDLRTQKVSMLPGSAGLFSPRWSPNGRYIAALPTDTRKQVLFDFKAQEWTDLVNAAGAEQNWSRDGRYLYFLSLGANPAIVRCRISDRKLERVVPLSSFPLAWAYGPWTGLAPDGSPLVVRDMGSQEVYSSDWKAP